MKSDIDEVLSRGVGVLIDPDGGFRKKLQEKAEGKYKKDIIIKLGIDPTRPDIHLGFAVVLRKLRQFQDMGCKVVFIVGDFTAQIGDPEGKSKVRPELDQATVEANAKTYIEQVGKILKTDKEHFSWIRNSDWFYSPADLLPPQNINNIALETSTPDGKKNSLSFTPDSLIGKTLYYESTRMQTTHLGRKNISGLSLLGLLRTLRKITHSRLIERDFFQDRINSGGELYMHEMLYPVLQGIDSHLIALIYGSCDLEIGGTDQHFNMLMGRDVMKMNNQEPQAVMTMEILPGTDGKEKMSKSLDNYIAITETPEEMFGKVMSIPDSVMIDYFRLTTYTPVVDVEEIKAELEKGKANPRDVKARLAREIIEIYHGREKALAAESNFEKVFKSGEMPESAPEIVSDGKTKLSELLLSIGLVSSKTEFRRLVDEGAVSDMDGNKITDQELAPKNDLDLRVGKKRFVKIRVK